MTGSVDAIILGCGVSGLTAAHDLSREGARVAVLDDYAVPGGNHISRDIAGCSFDIGAIFFWSNSPYCTMFPEATEGWVPVDFTIGRITPGWAVHKYPFDVRAELLALPMARKLSIGADIAWHRLFHWKRRNLHDFAIRHLGRQLFEDSGLAVYVERLCGLPADQVLYSFAERRMRWLSSRTSLRAILRGRAGRTRARFAGAPSEPALQAYARPRAGFASMYGAAVERLKNAGATFVFDAGLRSIARTATGYRVETARGTWEAPRLINTLPLAIAARLAGIEGLAAPRSSRMTSLFCRFRGDRGFPYLVLYNFNPEGTWKRLTMHSDYYGRTDGYEYFSVECTHGGRDVPDAELFRDFVATTGHAGIFNGELELVGSMVTDFAYPILDAASEQGRKSIMGRLSELGIAGIGRQGSFDYIPSSTLAIELARKGLAAHPSGGK